MLNFNKFLSEQTDDAPRQQKHLPHTPESIFGGHDGVAQADAALRALDNHLSGKRRNVPARVEKKIDGAPAVMVFKDENGRVGVGTKSVQNKNPKLNYTEEDIDRNHGHAPGLAAALKQVLAHAHKVVPPDMKPGEMYKGDLLFTQGEKGLKRKNGFVSAQPNLLNYMWQKGTPEAEKASNAKMGIAFHTYFGRDGNAQPISAKQRAKFVDHPDVFNYNPAAEVNPQNYTPEEKKAFENHMENARNAYSSLSPDAYERLAGHNDHLVSYINGRVRNGQEGSGKVEDYKDYLTARAQKDIDSVKTQAAKDKKSQKWGEMIQQASVNSKDLQKILDVHNHIQNAKHVLLGVMNKNSKETIQGPNGENMGHEGYVVTMPNGEQSKIVDQQPSGFASKNLSGQGIIGSARASKQIKEETQSGSHGMTIGGFSPYTTAHDSVVNSIKNGGHDSVSVFTTQSSKRPIPVENKVGYIKTAAGKGVDVAATKTPFHALSNMYASGKRGSVTVYGGSDRASMVDQLRNYNGKSGPHGHYNFDSINFKQVGGERGEKAEGMAGVSGTKARASKSPEELKQYLPKKLHKHAESIFNDINSVKEETDTTPAADAPSVAELSARGSMESGGKKKKLKENTTASVGGLGFNTGNPAVDDEKISSYATTNALAQDDENGNLLNMMKKTQSSISNRIGFKAFDPTQKGKK